MSKHFTAILEVKESETTGTISKPERAVAEVARIVVRAETLEALQKKLSAHVALIEN